MSIKLTESFRVLFTCRVRCHVHVLPKRRSGFGAVVNFSLLLLSAYWVLSVNFLAVLEISVCAY